MASRQKLSRSDGACPRKLSGNKMSPFDAARNRAVLPFESANRVMRDHEAAVVAVIDPDGQARAAASRLCEGEGYRVLPFASGEEFLRAGPPNHVTCIVLDISTPDRQGIEVLRRLAERGAAPPVIVLTGQADIGLVVEAMKLRAID